MAYADEGKVISLKAGDTITSGIALYMSAANTVAIAVTSSVAIIGISGNYADSGASVPVIVDGVAKCVCNASIGFGDLVGLATDAAGKVKSLNGINNTASTMIPLIGIALETGTSTSLIPVALQLGNSVLR